MDKDHQNVLLAQKDKFIIMDSVEMIVIVIAIDMEMNANHATKDVVLAMMEMIIHVLNVEQDKYILKDNVLIIAHQDIMKFQDHANNVIQIV